jgi:chromosome segregation ATPase
MYRNVSPARRLAAVLMLAVLAACTTVPAPVQELAEAEHAVQAASASDAMTLAPAEVDKARRKLEAARSALRAQDHTLARRLAEQAVVDAELAQITARAEETERAAAAIETQIGGPGEIAVQPMGGS